MKFFLLGICFLTSVALHSQKILQGKLLSADDKKPISSASVYLSNTSVGTISKDDGSFVINNFPEGRYDLVVSRQGYITHTQIINSGNLPNDLMITLKRRIIDLQEVVIEGYLKEGWKDWGSFFMAHLIGNTPNAKDCELQNKDAVRFRLKKNPSRLEAVAHEPLIIVNKALGYHLTYDLELFSFQLNAGLCTYQGYPLFKELEAPDEKTKQTWLHNRQEAYEGSMMHFMRSLYRNKVTEEGFVVKHLLRRRRNVGSGITERLPDILVNVPLTGDSIAYSIDKATVQMQFNDYLQVTYPAKKIPRAYMKDPTTRPPERLESLWLVPGARVDNTPKLTTKQALTSELVAPNSGEGVQVLYNGHYYFSTNLISMLYWAWSEKLSNLLPLDYGNPVPINAETAYKPQ